MKATDLMLGDWVRYQDKTIARDFRVAVITQDYIVGEFSSDRLPCKIIDPTPLTAEILNKNFPQVESGVEWHITANDELFLIYVEYDGSRYIEGIFSYVHELQHVLRLCGIEKEITI